jgi:hypothetical protein
VLVYLASPGGGDEENEVGGRQNSPWLGGAKLDRSGPFPQAALRRWRCITTSTRMARRDKWRQWLDNPVVEWTMLGTGLILMAIAPLLGPIPGPGGIPVFAAGLVLVLKSGMWAKRRYARFKRWRPKVGRWTDWALRRPSARRREAIRKAKPSATRN